MFFSLNYICASYLIYTKENNQNIKLSTFIKYLSLASTEGSSINESTRFNKIIASAKASNSIKIKKKRYFVIFSYIVTLATYALVIAAKNPMGNKFLGIINASLIIVTDQM